MRLSALLGVTEDTQTGASWGVFGAGVASQRNGPHAGLVPGQFGCGSEPGGSGSSELDEEEDEPDDLVLLDPVMVSPTGADAAADGVVVDGAVVADPCVLELGEVVRYAP